MAEKEYHKCNREQGMCGLLHDITAAVGSHVKGFVYVSALSADFKTKKLLGVMYKESAQDRGVMLNHCPFCGEKIDWFRDGRKEKEFPTTAST